jgi:hypothetical protein
LTAVDPQSVTWVRVERPVFDLWGVITSSLTFSLGLLAFGLVLGCLFGWLRIRRAREHADDQPLLAGLGSGLTTSG